jgi:predicted deacylase
VSIISNLENLSCKNFLKEFRKIWKGSEIKLNKKVSMFCRGRGKCTMIVISGIHGEERAGPVAIFCWAKRLAKMAINGRICVVPIMHPLAWDLRIRKPNNLNLNSIWNKQKCVRASQVKKMMKIIKRQQPLIYLDLHEDTSISDEHHYIWRAKDCIWGKQLQKKLKISTKKGLWKKHDYETSESFAHSVGINRSFTVESDPHKSLKERINFHQLVLKEAFIFSNNKKNWI